MVDDHESRIIRWQIKEYENPNFIFMDGYIEFKMLKTTLYQYLFNVKSLKLLLSWTL